MKEYLINILTGTTKYQRAKKEWFKKRVYKFRISEGGYNSDTIKYERGEGRSLTYYGNRSGVSQFMNFLYKKKNYESFFLAKYESMLKEPKVSFSYELVVDYEKKIFDELSTQDRRDRALEKLGL